MPVRLADRVEHVTAPRAANPGMRLVDPVPGEVARCATDGTPRRGRHLERERRNVADDERHVVVARGARTSASTRASEGRGRTRAPRRRCASSSCVMLEDWTMPVSHGARPQLVRHAQGAAQQVGADGRSDDDARSAGGRPSALMTSTSREAWPKPWPEMKNTMVTTGDCYRRLRPAGRCRLDLLRFFRVLQRARLLHREARDEADVAGVPAVPASRRLQGQVGATHEEGSRCPAAADPARRRDVREAARPSVSRRRQGHLRAVPPRLRDPVAPVDGVSSRTTSVPARPGTNRDNDDSATGGLSAASVSRSMSVHVRHDLPANVLL